MNKLINWIVLWFLLINCIMMQVPPSMVFGPVAGVLPPSNPVAASLAVGGFVQALLNTQIRSEGGYYENNYKEPKTSLPNENEAGYTEIDHSRDRNVVRDGRSLRAALNGEGPNPCYDIERLSRNRLLALACTAQLLQQSNDKPTI